jgi:DNA (cytosine-5)-methyltransferase 1
VLLRGTNGGQVANSARSLNNPTPTITTSGAHIGLCEPFLTAMNFTKSREHDERYSLDPNSPLPTVTTQGNRFGLVEPFIVPAAFGEREGQGARVHNLDNPLPTVLGSNTHALVEPFVIGTGQPNANGSYVYGADRPLPTITSANDLRLVEPFVTPYYANGEADSVNDPLRTITTRDRFGLVEPVAGGNQPVRLDILFRMLQPHELAAAMGFPPGYVFKAKRKSDVVKMIGNAVSVENAQAMSHTILEDAA